MTSNECEALLGKINGLQSKYGSSHAGSFGVEEITQDLVELKVLVHALYQRGQQPPQEPRTGPMITK